ncbi:MAG: cation transporter [Candidatus Moraniibacteriota bacterium]
MPHSHDPSAEYRRYLRLAPISFFTFFVEVTAGIATGSLALVTDALHTLLDGFENLLNAFIAHQAGRFRDPRPLRVKGFAASLVLIGLSTLFMGFEAVGQLRSGTTHPLSSLALVIAVFSLGMNLWQFRIHHGAPAEHRNINHWGQNLHILTDIGGSLAAILGTGLSVFFGLPGADAWAALGIVTVIWGRMLYGVWSVFIKKQDRTHWSCGHDHH